MGSCRIVWDRAWMGWDVVRTRGPGACVRGVWVGARGEVWARGPGAAVCRVFRRWRLGTSGCSCVCGCVCVWVGVWVCGCVWRRTGGGRGGGGQLPFSPSNPLPPSLLSSRYYAPLEAPPPHPLCVSYAPLPLRVGPHTTAPLHHSVGRVGSCGTYGVGSERIVRGWVGMRACGERLGTRTQCGSCGIVCVCVCVCV